MAEHTIIVDVPELFHPDDVEAAITANINAMIFIKGAAASVTVVQYHQERMIECADPDCGECREDN